MWARSDGRFEKSVLQVYNRIDRPTITVINAICPSSHWLIVYRTEATDRFGHPDQDHIEDGQCFVLVGMLSCVPRSRVQLIVRRL